MSYVDRIILGGRAKKFKWLSESATYTPITNKDQFLDENTNYTLYFDGGDKDYINSQSGNRNKYDAWLQRLADNPIVLEISTKNITNLQ